MITRRLCACNFIGSNIRTRVTFCFFTLDSIFDDLGIYYGKRNYRMKKKINALFCKITKGSMTDIVSCRQLANLSFLHRDATAGKIFPPESEFSKPPRKNPVPNKKESILFT